MGIAVDVAYVGTKGDGGYADLDINAPQVIGVGDAGRPYASLAAARDLKLLGPAAEDAVSRAAGGREPAVHERPAAQGRLHLVQGDEHGRRRRLDGRCATTR